MTSIYYTSMVKKRSAKSGFPQWKCRALKHFYQKAFLMLANSMFYKGVFIEAVMKKPWILESDDTKNISMKFKEESG